MRRSILLPLLLAVGIPLLAAALSGCAPCCTPPEPASLDEAIAASRQEAAAAVSDFCEKENVRCEF